MGAVSVILCLRLLPSRHQDLTAASTALRLLARSTLSEKRCKRDTPDEHPQNELEKRLEDAERELSSLSADLAAAHKRLRRDGGSSTAEEQLAAARKCKEAALAQV